MNYKVIELDSMSADHTVELRFAVASERAEGTELLRVDIPFSENEKEHVKIMSSITKTLKQMKEERLIQFYATKKSFSSATTESQFLLNKYPSVFICGITDNMNADFVYIKL